MTAPQLTIMQGDALEKLRELPDESVHCVVTSPPYWGLRDYSKCSCVPQGRLEVAQDDRGDRHTPGGAIAFHRTGKAIEGCPICNGTGINQEMLTQQLGLEKTPEEYVHKIVKIFREVRRVLRKDGGMWLNLGDTYAGGAGGYDPKYERPELRDKHSGFIGANGGNYREKREWTNHPVLKPKDQCLIPHRVAIALQADGWWVRQTVIWSKNNPMPESCRDRCTSSHEYIFHLTKSAKYFYDQEAIREPFNYPDRKYNPNTTNHKTLGLREIGNRSTVGLHDGRTQYGDPKAGRNKRSVWTMSTRPYPEAHFATFPPELPETCIKAGTSLKGCCLECGAPWERETEQEVIARRKPEEGIRANTPELGQDGANSLRAGFRTLEIRTIGWQPTCSCGIEETIPCTVLDIFAGSGTTGEVARGLGRSCILIELNPEYIKLIKERTKYDIKAVDSFAFEGNA